MSKQSITSSWPITPCIWFKIGDTPSTSNQDNALHGVAEIKTGIYRDDNGAVYQVIGTATHAELPESVVVYRELFGEYRFLVTPVRALPSYSDHQGSLI